MNSFVTRPGGSSAELQPLAEVRRGLEAPDLFNATTWRQGAQLGWTAFLIPSDHGGGSVTDQPLVDLIVLAEELGRELNPGPLVPCNVVADAIAGSVPTVQCKEYLAALAAGDVVPAGASAAMGLRIRGPSKSLRQKTGTPGTSRAWPAMSRVPATPRVFLVVAHHGDDVVSVLVPSTRRGSRCRSPGLDLTRRYAEVRFDRVAIPDSAAIASGVRSWNEDWRSPLCSTRQSRSGRPTASSRRPSTTPRSECNSAAYRQLSGTETPDGRHAARGRRDAGRHVLRRPRPGRGL